MSSPAAVVSTLNRYLFLDSPNVAFLHRITLVKDKPAEESNTINHTPPLSIKLTFTFQHAQHAVFFRLVKPAGLPLSTISTSDDDWTISSVAATHHDLPVTGLQSSLVHSTRLGYPLFRSIEGCIRVLRTFLLTDESCRQAVFPWVYSPARYIQQTLLPSSAADGVVPLRAPSSSSLLSLDLLCTLLYAAMSSSRSTTLVNPFPPCFISQSSDEAASQDEMKVTDDQLNQRLDSKLITQRMPRLEAAFSQLPALSTIDFSSSIASSLPDPPPVPSPLTPLHSLPPDVLALLSSLLSSHVRLTSVPVQPNLYTLGTSEAHLHALANSSLPSNSLTLPSYQFNLSPLPDPLFTLSSHRHSTFLAYHGSPLYNWHSILHRGLESKSGTKEQTSGALFGEGIYLSDDLRVARMFSGVGRGWSRGGLGERLEVVGLYEVVNDPAGVRKQREEMRGGEDEVPENYYVVKDNQFIRLKSVLVWRVKEERSERRGWWMIVAYAVVLLAIIASRVDWKYTTKVATRFIHQVGL